MLPVQGDWGSIPGQGTRSHMLQLNILRAATKTWQKNSLWWIHFDIWQNQYNIVKFKNKIKLKINKYKKKQKENYAVCQYTEINTDFLPVTSSCK